MAHSGEEDKKRLCVSLIVNSNVEKDKERRKVYIKRDQGGVVVKKPE